MHRPTAVEVATSPENIGECSYTASRPYLLLQWRWYPETRDLRWAKQR